MQQAQRNLLFHSFYCKLLSFRRISIVNSLVIYCITQKERSPKRNPIREYCTIIKIEAYLIKNRKKANKIKEVIFRCFRRMIQAMIHDILWNNPAYKAVLEARKSDAMSRSLSDFWVALCNLLYIKIIHRFFYRLTRCLIMIVSRNELIGDTIHTQAIRIFLKRLHLFAAEIITAAAKHYRWYPILICQIREPLPGTFHGVHVISYCGIAGNHIDFFQFNTNLRVSKFGRKLVRISHSPGTECLP